MMSNKRFWPAFVSAALLCGGALQAVSISLIGLPAPRPPLPIPGYEYISATRDGQTDHSLFYFNIFGFGDRIKSADAIVIGSSHAEFGIDSSMLSKDRGFNMALGGGEGLSFAATLLEKYQPCPSIIALDPFSPDPDGPSTEAARVLASTQAVSYRKVFNIWSGFMRDWMLQGLVPRITISLTSPSWEQPVGTTIIRNWQSADVTAVYSNSGELFADASRGHPIVEGPIWTGFPPSADELRAIKERTDKILVTAIPYPSPSFSDQMARETAIKLGAPFIPVPSDDLLFWDYHHLNKSGRARATSILLRTLDRRFQN
jgi:hypothetical protein